MSIVTNSDVLAYLAACGQAVPTALNALVTMARTSAEIGLRNFVGYNPERQTVVDLLPHGTGNVRGDGDYTAAGFDLSAGGQVVARGIGRESRRELVLTQLPVRSITSAYDNATAWNTDGGYWPDSSLLNPNTYYLDAPQLGAKCWSGIVYRGTGSWSQSPRCVKVTYESGLTPAELAEDGEFVCFRMAVLTACAAALGKIIARGRVALTGHVVTSVSIEDFSASFGGAGGSSLGTADGVGLAGVDFPTESRMYVKNYRHPAFLI